MVNFLDEEDVTIFSKDSASLRQWIGLAGRQEIELYFIIGIYDQAQLSRNIG